MEKILPYPLVPSKKDKERQLARFMEIFKQLQIKIPLFEAIQQMSTYAKFLKNLLTKKRKYIKEDTIEVQGKCNTFIFSTFIQ